MAATTSFQKKTRVKSIQIVGTRPSLHNNQLLVSSGIPSLDNFMGGGLAVGTILLIEEDQHGSYGKVMLKYFLSEGIMNKHEIFLASADTSPEQLIKELPGPLVDDPGVSSSAEENEAMKIAWRYQNQGQAQVVPSGIRFGHYYDLTKTMNPEQIAATTITSYDTVHDCNLPSSNSDSMNVHYAQLLKQIKSKLEDGGYDTKMQKQHRNIMRIGIHSLGSPQWGEEGGSGFSSSSASLGRFLYGLKSLLRSAYAVCAITIPSHLYEDEAFTKRIELLCDTVVQLDSFVGSDKEKNPAFKEYHGLFNILKLPRLNSLMCHMPETLDLAFKLRRKKFMIEKLHLPPELSETANRNQEDPVLPKPGALACGSGSSNKLDF